MPRRLLVPIASLVAAAVFAGCVMPPEDVECRAGKEGNFISWSPVENATHYKVYRGTSETEEPVLIDRTYDTSYLDTNVTQGQTYFYWVTAVGPMPDELPDEIAEDPTIENESPPSEVCELTAVPMFPSLVVGAVATVGVVGAYVGMRRRG